MNFIITGSNGRMGKSLVKLLSDKNEDIVKLSREYDLSAINTGKQCVVIDFSSPVYFDKILDWSVANNIPFVSGTTGLSDMQFKKLADASSKIPVLWAPNMSMGIAFMNMLVSKFSELAQDFDFQIEELHHRHKVDQPSGTGIFLQETLKKAVKKDIPEVLSVRGGGIYGVHKVWAMSEEETITIEHQALNRDVFASGAIKCAHWLGQKAPGNYSIADVVSDT